MGRLIYTLNVSLDGYIETPDHRLDWSSIDDELHGWFNERMREVAASLYGRGVYETMNAYWPTSEADPAATPVMREYGRIWRATPRIVFSSTLETVAEGSRLVRGEATEELARVRREFDGDLEVAGATLAASFIAPALGRHVLDARSVRRTWWRNVLQRRLAAARTGAALRWYTGADADAPGDRMHDARSVRGHSGVDWNVRQRRVDTGCP